MVKAPLKILAKSLSNALAPSGKNCLRRWPPVGRLCKAFAFIPGVPIVCQIFARKAARSLCSLTRFSAAQGHTVRLNESITGIVLHDGKGKPCCLESETGCVLLPCFPPPSSATFVCMPREMQVIDFNASVMSGTYVSVLAAATFCAAAAASFSSASSSADASSSSSSSAS